MRGHWFVGLAGAIIYVPLRGAASSIRVSGRISDDLRADIPGLSRFYDSTALPDDERPRVYTGAGRVGSDRLLVPETLWFPKPPNSPPPAAAPPPAPPR